jgi:hypothetical protein
VRQLFEPVLADARSRERLLAGAAASAAPVFEAVAPPGAGAGDGSFAALHGLYRRVRGALRAAGRRWQLLSRHYLTKVR